MSNSFLFVIPLTPESHLTSLRKELQGLCFQYLLSQTYGKWKALIIGAEKPKGTEDSRFIFVAEEGYKELKLQHATRYIRDNEIDCDYIIRLDDDDLFNPMILNKYKASKADIIVDLKHWFIEWKSKQCSADFRPWFANTVIHKRENALVEYGKIAREGIDQVNKKVSLIETNHALMHTFYKKKKVVFENESPIYLRVLNEDSITSNAGKSYGDYLKEFGGWNSPIPNEFLIAPIDKERLKKLNIRNKNLKQKVFEMIQIRSFKKLFR